MGIKNKIVLFFKRDGARCQLVTKIALYEITGILALRNVMNRDVHKNGKQRGKNSSKTHWQAFELQSQTLKSWSKVSLYGLKICCLLSKKIIEVKCKKARTYIPIFSTEQCLKTNATSKRAVHVFGTFLISDSRSQSVYEICVNRKLNWKFKSKNHFFPKLSIWTRLWFLVSKKAF